MTFEDTLNQAVGMLQRQGRLTYQTLQLQFHLDDRHFEALKDQLLYAHPQSVTDDGRGLVWTGVPPTDLSGPQSEMDKETRFHAALPAVIAFLQREGRVTYSTLKLACGLDDWLSEKICEELQLRRLAIDEAGKVLAWTGEALPTLPPGVISTPTPTHKFTALPERSFTEITRDEAVVTSQPVSHVAAAERRQLTVMFCDLADSTRLSQQLDPEDLREVVRAYQEEAARVIEGYEGHIAQYLGDGLLIYFGWPQAHENDAERAVYTGLEIPQAIDKLNHRLQTDRGVQLSVRIGIHTGPVVVGEMGGGSRHETLALGETPNIAARLEGIANPNTVVLSPTTAQLVQRAFILEELGYHELKGVGEACTRCVRVGNQTQSSLQSRSCSNWLGYGVSVSPRGAASL